MERNSGQQTPSAVVPDSEVLKPSTRESTSVLGAEVEQVMDRVHHLLLLSLQGCAVSCRAAQLGFQLPDDPALAPHQVLQASFLLLQRLQLLLVPRLHF